MRTAEVEVNQKVTFMANDREHKAFKLACVENNESAGRVLREAMRQYVRDHEARKRKAANASN